MKFNKKIESLIADLQKITGLDSYFFLRSSFWIGIRQALGSVSGIAITLAFVHLGSKSLFGQYNLLLSLFGLAGILSLHDFNVAVLESVSKGFDSSFKKAFRTKFIWSLIGILIALVLAAKYLVKDKVIGQALLWIAIFVPLFYAPGIYTSFLTAKKKFKILTRFQSTTSIITALYFILAILLTKNIVYIFFFFVLLTSALNLYFYNISRKYVKTKNDDPELISYGFFLSKLSLLSRVSSYVEKILLSSFLGVESLAIYSIALKVPNTIKKQVLAFFTPSSVKIAHLSERKSFDALKTHFSKLLLIGIFLSLAVWITIPWIIRILLGQEYFSAILYSQLLSLSFIFEPVVLLFSSFLRLQKKQKLTLFLNIALPLVQIFLYFLLLPRWGIYGLIAVKLAQQFLVFLISTKVIFSANLNLD